MFEKMIKKHKENPLFKIEDKRLWIRTVNEKYYTGYQTVGIADVVFVIWIIIFGLWSLCGTLALILWIHSVL